MRHSPYLGKALNDLPEIVNRAVDTLSFRKVQFDAIVVTGVSGMLLGPILAYQLGKRLAIVRKEDDKQNHATVRIEHGMNADDRWIFVDDITASGQTYDRVKRLMSNIKAGEPVGSYMYNWDEWTEGGY